MYKAILTATAILACTAPAFAIESGAPVKITSCVVASDTPNTPLRPGVTLTNGVAVSVVNTSDKPISDVTVSGTYNGTAVTDTIKQALAPGSSATLRRSHAKLVYTGPDAQTCYIKHVTFADGTTWSAASHKM